MMEPQNMNENLCWSPLQVITTADLARPPRSVLKQRNMRKLKKRHFAVPPLAGDFYTDISYQLLGGCYRGMYYLQYSKRSTVEAALFARSKYVQVRDLI